LAGEKTLLQRVFRPPAFGDIGEGDAHLALTSTEGSHFEPSFQEFDIPLAMNRFSRRRNFSVGLNPEWIQAGKNFTNRFPHSFVPRQAAVRFKRGVGLQIAEVAR